MENKSLPVFTIGVVADIISVSVQTLRLWENKGLIKPSRKGKDRYYSQDDLKKLKYIKHLLSEKKLNTYGVKELLEQNAWQEYDDGTELPAGIEGINIQDDVADDKPAGKGSSVLDRKRVLIIDDDFDHVSVVKTILESENFEVMMALSGRDGIEKAKKEMPDLIILDVMIPDLDGLEICRTLKKSSEYSSIPIMMMSSIPENMRSKFGINSEELPANAFMYKPVRPAAFLEQIKKMLT